MARFSFHLGVHRSASTSLQKHLESVESRFPHVCIRGRRQLRGCDHRPLRWLTREELPAWVAHLAAAAFEGSTRVDRAPEYLISEENLMGRMLGRVPRLYPHAGQLADAFDTLRVEGHEVRALLVVREPVALVESCYRFLRGTPFARGSIDVFVDSLQWESLRWIPILDPLQRVLGDGLHVVPFEWMTRRPRRYLAALRQFHEAFGGLKLRARHNASAPAAWLAVSLAAAQAGVPLSTPEFRRAGRAFAARTVLQRPPAPTPAEHSAWIGEARAALAGVSVELSSDIVAAGLKRWLHESTSVAHLSPERARQIRDAVSHEWDELFLRFMPRANPRLWAPSRDR